MYTSGGFLLSKGERMFENIFQGVMIGGVALIVMIVGLVEFSKRLGVSGKWLLVEAMVLGMVFYGANKAAEMYPAIQQWLELAVYTFGGGLAATGIFDVVNKRLPEIELDGE
jgi:hypothetical protein